LELKIRENYVILSHDIDNQIFIKEQFVSLLNISKALEVPTSWFIIPFSRKYDFNSQLFQNLRKQDREMGIHGFSHDGFLDKIGPEKVEKRIIKAKMKFKNLPIDNLIFRSPYMLRSKEILQILQNNGFFLDSSFPDKNTLKLTKEKPGIEFNRPFYPPFIKNKFLNTSSNLIEVPSTYPQDVQLINDFKVDKEEIIKYWKYKFKFIKDYRGVFVFHGHPIYLLNYMDLYRDLILFLKKQNAKFTSFTDLGQKYKKNISEAINCKDLFFNF
jgi:peptidoglycan/xylan/chitin deacetylase (PgdA/CDA1 family)